MVNFRPHVEIYGVLLALAWLLGWWLTRRRARHLEIATWHIDGLLPLLLIGAGLGSRFGGRLSQLLADGAANDRVLFGGLLAGVAVAIAYGLAARIPLGRLGDAFAFSLPAGIALLRVGCFSAGCCWGDVCAGPGRLAAAVDDRAWLQQVQTFPSLSGDDWPLAVRYPAGSPAFQQHLTAGLLPPGADRSLPVHPVQLYEAAAVLVLWGLLWLVDQRLRRWGESFLLFGLGYCAIRFACEWFRADSVAWVWGLTPAQLTCLGGAIMLAVAWGVRSWLAGRGHSGLCRRPLPV
jgi:phosphatidylglycerol---prolipoprotein diacylglyceryl transferase